MCLVAPEGGTFFSFFLRLIKKVHQFESYNGYKKHKKSPVLLYTHTRTCQFRSIWIQKWRREYAYTHTRKETEQLHLMLHGEGESHSWLFARWSPWHDAGSLSVFGLCNERMGQSYSSSARIVWSPSEAQSHDVLGKVWQQTCMTGQSDEVEKFRPNFTSSRCRETRKTWEYNSTRWARHHSTYKNIA